MRRDGTFLFNCGCPRSSVNQVCGRVLLLDGSCDQYVFSLLVTEVPRAAELPYDVGESPRERLDHSEKSAVCTRIFCRLIMGACFCRRLAGVQGTLGPL